MLMALIEDTRIDAELEARPTSNSTPPSFGAIPSIRFTRLSATALAVLRAMSGRLYGRLEKGGPFLLEPTWHGPVPLEAAEELHDAGLIEIDETAPLGDAFAFRVSEAGWAYLNSMPSSKRRAAG